MTRHVVWLSDPSDPSLLERIFAHPSERERHIELRLGDLFSHAPVVRALIDGARERSRAAGALVTFGIVCAGGGAEETSQEDELLAWLLDAEVVFTIVIDGSSEARRLVARLHEKYAARGISPVRAYLNGFVPVTRAMTERSGEVLVDALLAAGLVYVELAPAADVAIDRYHAFRAGFLGALLLRNLAGALLVEKRLAIDLEALAAAPRGTRPAGSKADAVFAHEVEGGVRLAATSIPSAECTACRYNPYCGSTLPRRWLIDELDTKAFGTAYCARSMGTFGDLFARLSSPTDSAVLHRVFAAWMAARDDVSHSRK